MAGGYTIPINAETKAYKQSVDLGMIKPTEDAQKALEELGKTRGPEQLEKQLQDDQKATERLKDDTEDTANAIDREYRDAYRKMKQASDDGFDKAKQGADEFKSEMGQSGREAAASFSGEISDIGDFAQETLANGLSGFGPIGAAAGIAAAVGLGTLWASIETNTQEAKQLVSDMYDDMIESGQRFVSAEFINDKISELIKNEEKLSEIRADGNRIGIDESVLLRAQAGDMASVSEAVAAAIEYRDDLNRRLAESEPKSAAAAQAQDKLRDSADALVSKYLGLGDAQDSAARKADLAREAMDGVSSSADGAAGAVSRYNVKLDEVPPNVRTMLSVDSAEAEASLRRITDMALALDGRSIAIRIEGQTGAGRFIL